MAKFTPVACAMAGGHTCVAYEERSGRIYSIAMNAPELAMRSMKCEEFHAEWKPIQGCDAQMAADRYLKGHMPYSDEIKLILERIKNMEPNTEASTVVKPPMRPEKKVVAVRPGADLPTAKAPSAKAPSAKAAVKPVATAKPVEQKALTPAEREKAKNEFFAGKGKPEAKPEVKAKAVAPSKTEAKPAKTKAPKLEDADVIKLLKAAATRRGNEGSIRSQVFAKIKDGMTVGAVVKACTKFANEKQVLADLLKLATHPATPFISFSKKK